MLYYCTTSPTLIMITESMKISDEQLEVFNIFKLINPSILLKPGQRISTISNNKNIMGVADFNTLNIPVKAPIYDLHVFLNTMNIVSGGDRLKSDVDFQENLVNISHGRSKMKYYYADERMITAPPDKLANLGDPVQTVNIEYGDFTKMFNAAATYSLPDICFVAHEGSLSAMVTDKRNSSSNVFTVDLGETDKEFCFCVKTENLRIVCPTLGGVSKIVSGYKVELFTSKVAKLSAIIKSTAKKELQNLDLLVALEPDSEY